VGGARKSESREPWFQDAVGKGVKITWKKPLMPCWLTIRQQPWADSPRLCPVAVAPDLGSSGIHSAPNGSCVPGPILQSFRPPCPIRSAHPFLEIPGAFQVFDSGDILAPLTSLAATPVCCRSIVIRPVGQSCRSSHFRQSTGLLSKSLQASAAENQSCFDQSQQPNPIHKSRRQQLNKMSAHNAGRGSFRYQTVHYQDAVRILIIR
jgi:hypothetical protein